MDLTAAREAAVDAALARLDLETKVAILRKKAEAENLNLSEEVAMFIASRAAEMRSIVALASGFAFIKRSKSVRRRTSNWQKVRATTSACRSRPDSKAISPKNSPLPSRTRRSGRITSTAPDAMKKTASPRSPLRIMRSFGTANRGRSNRHTRSS